jgi:uncharacterized small protein (DUF1192 family)
MCLLEQMDRRSILGNAIDYMKELLERIKQLQEEIARRAQCVQGAQSQRDGSQ